MSRKKPKKWRRHGESPFQISTAAELYWFAGLVNGTLEGEQKKTAACAILTDDIVLNDNVLKEDGSLNEESVDEFVKWKPIGVSGDDAYTGTFDGNNNKISGLYINDGDASVGLFGCIGEGATVRNVGIVDSYINFSGNYAGGGVCGYNYGGTIENCYNTGAVSSTSASFINYVGGICGWNNGTITNCYNTGTVSGRNAGGSNYAGGICGQNMNTGKIENCYNTGTVSGTTTGGSNYAGGVCGWNLGVPVKTATILKVWQLLPTAESRLRNTSLG